MLLLTPWQPVPSPPAQADTCRPLAKVVCACNAGVFTFVLDGLLRQLDDSKPQYESNTLWEWGDSAEG